MKALDFCIKNRQEIFNKGKDNQTYKEIFHAKRLHIKTIDFYNSIDVNKENY